MTIHLNELQFYVASCKNTHNNPAKKGAYKVKIATEAGKWDTQLKFFPACKSNLVSQSSADKKAVVDIYSLNYEFKMQDKTAFSQHKNFKKMAKELTKVPQKLYNFDAQVLLVLDMKTLETGYSDKDAIQAKEQEFLALFQQQEKLSVIKKLCDSGLHYVFLEGSLKADLLGKGLFNRSNEELNSSNEEHLKSRTADFCQLVEFLINAFKHGDTVVIKNKCSGVQHSFNATDYIVKIAQKIPDYKPASVSHTIYPKQYKHIATEGIYTKAMTTSGLFKITNTLYDETGIVHMTTEKEGLACPV